MILTTDYEAPLLTEISLMEPIELLNLESVKQILLSDNIIKIPMNVKRIIEKFEEKIVKKVEDTKKYSNEFRCIVKEDIDCAYLEILEELQNILENKRMEIDSKILLEYYAREPITEVEKMKFQAIIDNIIKDYSYSYIEELSDLLVIRWLTIEERAYEDMKAEDLAKSKDNNKK